MSKDRQTPNGTKSGTAISFHVKIVCISGVQVKIRATIAAGLMASTMMAAPLVTAGPAQAAGCSLSLASGILPVYDPPGTSHIGDLYLGWNGPDPGCRQTYAEFHWDYSWVANHPNVSGRMALMRGGDPNTNFLGQAIAVNSYSANSMLYWDSQFYGIDGASYPKSFSAEVEFDNAGSTTGYCYGYTWTYSVVGLIHYFSTGYNQTYASGGSCGSIIG